MPELDFLCAIIWGSGVVPGGFGGVPRGSGGGGSAGSGVIPGSSGGVPGVPGGFRVLQTPKAS